MSAKNKGGRPRMADEDKARNQLTVYLTDIQLADLAEKAAKQNMSTSQWLIKAAVRKLPKSIPEINRSAYTDLGKVGGNLNQIARKLNEGGQVSVSYLLSEIDALKALISDKRLDIIGAQS